MLKTFSLPKLGITSPNNESISNNSMGTTLNSTLKHFNPHSTMNFQSPKPVMERRMSRKSHTSMTSPKANETRMT